MSTTDYIWELKAVAAAAVLTVLASRTVTRFGTAAARPLRRLSRRPFVAASSIGLASLALTTLLAEHVGHPRPYIHDEFAYVLSADTFARGRLTNPTHPMWEHFESYHIFHQPSYQAKYPPAQGLALSAGQIFAGQAIRGVHVSLSLACIAVYWMLRGWTRPRWALLGGMIAAIHPGIVLQWGESYWGGAMAMLGGALVFGALPRLTSCARLRDAVLFALGLAVLANSRPYEGFVAAFPAILILAVWFFRDSVFTWSQRVTRVALPVILILAGVAVWMGYYNWRLTGDALKLPYQHWMKQYATGMDMKELLWRVDDGEQSRAPSFELASLPPGSTSADIVRIHSTSLASKLIRHHLFYYRVPLTLTVIALPMLMFQKRTRLAVGIYALVWLAVISNRCSGHGHYYAPATALILLIVVEGLRRMRCWRLGSMKFGQALTVAVPIILLSSSLRQFAVASDHFVSPGAEWVHSRDRIQRDLEQLGGRHLVLVHYQPGHNANIEWVYNGADLKSETVLWARPISSERAAELAAWFHNRSVWHLDADASPPKLTRWSRGTDWTSPVPGKTATRSGTRQTGFLAAGVKP